MNSIVRWDPFKEMEDLQARLSGLFTLPTLRRSEDKEKLIASDWSPLVDIVEDDKEYLIKTDLPDVKKEDVKVTVEKGVLTISGERRHEKEEDNKRFHRIERSYGSFLRSFVLPDDADEGKVLAEFKDGVLRVRLPKHEKAQSKLIDVKVA
jgi:HSP20 family protein